jgi:amidohydrolase
MLQRAQKIQPQLVAWRRDFHMHPELGFQEIRTAARVAEVLRALDYRVRTGVGRTGVVAELGSGKPVVAIRADMDALPIQDAKQVPYASTVPGVMHGCGHDAHTAIGLGVATLLARQSFPGTVRFLFQPAEEVNDEEGVSGAPRMIEDGAAEGIDIVLALHVDDFTPVGTISLRPGPATAGADTFYITLTGQGGHGASPDRTVDPIHIAGHVILALHGIVSRRVDPVLPAVVSIGSIHGGEADNVIPEEVKLTGTIRFMETAVQEKIHAEIERALGIARAMGGDFVLKIEIGCPPMVNDPGVIEHFRQVGTDLLGDDKILTPEPEMGAEDFGSFTAQAPGAMFYLGSRIEGDERQAHSPRFDIDESCLPIGVAVLAEAALRWLRQHEPEETGTK